MVKRFKGEAKEKETRRREHVGEKVGRELAKLIGNHC